MTSTPNTSPSPYKNKKRGGIIKLNEAFIQSDLSTSSNSITKMSLDRENNKSCDMSSCSNNNNSDDNNHDDAHDSENNNTAEYNNKHRAINITDESESNTETNESFASDYVSISVSSPQ